MVLIMIALVTGCAYKEGPEEEGLEIPGKSLLESAHIDYSHSVERKAGETKSLDITLDMRKDSLRRVSFAIWRVSKIYAEDRLPMPEGLDVSVEPSNFIAAPNNTYQSTIIIKTSPELPPGEYVLLLDVKADMLRGSGWKRWASGWITVNIEL
jgi:hypothetical protein